MSAILYPQGMSSYNNRKTHNLNLNTNPVLPTSYTSWKGSGAFSNPVGISSTHLAPQTLTNIYFKVARHYYVLSLRLIRVTHLN